MYIFPGCYFITKKKNTDQRVKQSKPQRFKEGPVGEHPKHLSYRGSDVVRGSKWCWE